MSDSLNRYSQLIEAIFLKHFTKGATEITFERLEIVHAAEKLGIRLPKNLGDVLYSFRYRNCSGCHCEERFLRRSNLSKYFERLLRSARNDKRLSSYSLSHSVAQADHG